MNWRRGNGRPHPTLKIAFVSGDRQAMSGCCYCQGEHSPQACNVVRSVRAVPAPTCGGVPFAGNTTTGCCVSTKNSVLLQTARATVFNPSHPERQWSVSIQFDSGSQRSYVTEGDFLNLKSMGHKSMTIMTFGSNKPEQAT